MIALVLMALGATLGFAYGIVSFALPFVPDMDVFTSTGIGFGLGAGASLILIAARLLFAVAHMATAVVLLIAPLAAWLFNLVTDPLGRKARARERARLDAIYPPAQAPRRRYVET